MTAHHTNTAHTTLVEEVAGVVENVPGVAFLRPALADRMRSALARQAPRTGRDRSAGVRMVRPDGRESWHVEIHVVVDRRIRALDVARAVRADVVGHLSALAPEQPAAQVTVTVTGRV
ncbi:hypothetical protein [Streptomyces sp. SID13726]|uniref:hypothetical protein n=1 Tax=Streptomyces sp. SID13726 TaxID=2706058 RepID=UPI0013BE7EBD|nr:hypothetical protein [Streptomyces sp. SID13726]NEB05081.1 hypothetical protein [Streptomyces sp. SID13726]